MAFYNPDQPQSPPIFVYALSTCAHCKNAKRLLDELGANYGHVEVDLLNDEEMAQALTEIGRYNPAETFPTIVSGSKVVVGYKESDIRQMAEKAARAAG